MKKVYCFAINLYLKTFKGLFTSELEELDYLLKV